eukprot:7852479-Pyramimonas_sp.AAC.1
MLIVDSQLNYSGSKSGGGGGQCGTVAVARGSSVRFGVVVAFGTKVDESISLAWREWHSAALCCVAVSN